METLSLRVLILKLSKWIDEEQPIAADICRTPKPPKSHPDGKIVHTFEVQIEGALGYKASMELDKAYQSPLMESLLMELLAAGFREGIKYAQSQK